jgi:hypothetical protein
MAKKKAKDVSSEHICNDECKYGHADKKVQRQCMRNARKSWQEMVKKVYPPYVEWRQNRWDWEDSYTVPQEIITLKLPLHKALCLDTLMVKYAAIELKKGIEDINTDRLFNCFDRSKFLEYVISRGAISFTWNEKTCEDEDMKQQSAMMEEMGKELRLLFSDKDAAIKEMVYDYDDEAEEDDE